jgi:hypothetical protein
MFQPRRAWDLYNCRSLQNHELPQMPVPYTNFGAPRMNYRLLTSTILLAGLTACSDANSGAPAEGTFSSTVDGVRFSGSPMVYFPRNTALIQDGDGGKLLVIHLVSFKGSDPQQTNFKWNFYLPVKTGRYTLTHDIEDSCNCHVTVENSDFLLYAPGEFAVDVQTLNADHVVVTFSGTLTLRDDYRVGHPNAKPQLVLTGGKLDVPITQPAAP